VLRKIKDGKAEGVDGVPGEVWKYGEERLLDWTVGFCNRVWKGKGWRWSGGMERRCNNSDREERRGKKSGGIQGSNSNDDSVQDIPNASWEIKDGVRGERGDPAESNWIQKRDGDVR